MKITFFRNPSAMRKWLEKNHKKVQELWIGFYKKDSGKPSITWPESVDEALCFGWIDGIRKSIDRDSYMIRFTPRKADSNWSLVNVKRVEELTKQGRMHASGLEVYNKRKAEKTGLYSFEQNENKLTPEFEELFRENKKAWKFFETQVPSYRNPCIRWVMSARQEETRMKRLLILIRDSGNGSFIAPMKWSKRGPKIIGNK